MVVCMAEMRLAHFKDWNTVMTTYVHLGGWWNLAKLTNKKAYTMAKNVEGFVGRNRASWRMKSSRMYIRKYSPDGK